MVRREQARAEKELAGDDANVNVATPRSKRQRRQAKMDLFEDAVNADAGHNDSSGQHLSLRALPTEPVMGNAIENLAANLMSMVEAPPLSHCQSVKHNGQMKELYERVHQLEEQIEILQWDVKSSITCQV